MPLPASATPSRSSIAVLLGTQTLFNIGFYAVVPFLAVVLTQDFLLASTAVGLILGIRTFAQQGLFLAGGALADRFGARAMILIGCAVRAAGFLTLAASLWGSTPVLWLFILGTLLTGFGGALFSPGLNILVAAAQSARDRKKARQVRRATLFAWLSITGEIGAVTGPLVGSALWGWGFPTVAGFGAAFFAAIGLFLAATLRRPAQAGAQDSAQAAEGKPRGSLRQCLGDRQFLAFCVLHAADLLAYNQVYLAIPLELERQDLATQWLGPVFAWISIVTLSLQIPLSWVAAKIGPATTLRIGYILSALGFSVLAFVPPAAFGDESSPVRILCAVTLMTLGHMSVHPTALSLVSKFAGQHPTGSYFGLLSSCGGVAVLLGNMLFGWLLSQSENSAGISFAPWLVLIIPLLLASWFGSRVVYHRLLRSQSA
ncbi:MFS transporter [Arthrobacter sp. NIO-1057]|uniref:MFS transporter n=1 Tax=Arthrobacter sp. NIO-1057 TaxID=993071 RepID=UPI0008186D39|nr:MFS transporter [Arthrobacter sp. NIO-1057]SCC28748.1 Nitrate/nitrite transporter NarK [Arthrobacter sp. NIO-1057]